MSGERGRGINPPSTSLHPVLKRPGGVLVGAHDELVEAALADDDGLRGSVGGVYLVHPLLILVQVSTSDGDVRLPIGADVHAEDAAHISRHEPRLPLDLDGAQVGTRWGGEG